MSAFPGLYASRRQGCSIPTQGYAAHGSPEENEAITFALEDSDAEVVEFWVPGETYALAVSAAAGQNVYAWIHASMGGIEATVGGEQASACPNAWHSDSSAEIHAVQWTAPASASVGAAGECVVFSTSQAGSSQAAYSTNSVRSTSLTFCLIWFWFIRSGKGVLLGSMNKECMEIGV